MNKNERDIDEMSEFWLDDWHQNILCWDQDQLDGIRGSMYICLGQNTHLNIFVLCRTHFLTGFFGILLGSP